MTIRYTILQYDASNYIKPLPFNRTMPTGGITAYQSGTLEITPRCSLPVTSNVAQVQA